MKTVGCVIILLLFPSTSILIAQWTNNPKINTPICTAESEQRLPVICRDGTGGAFIAWSETRNGTYDVYAQHVDAAGVRTWDVDGVSVCMFPGEQRVDHIIGDGVGGAIVCWHGAPNIGAPNGRLFVQRIDVSGTLLWDANGVAFDNMIYAEDAQMVSDGNGGVIMTWMGYRTDPFPSGIDIFAQHINSSGLLAWDAAGIDICTMENTQQDPKIVSDGAGGAIITWSDSYITAQVSAQRVNAGGAVQWTANGVVLCAGGSLQGSPSIVMDGAGGAIIAFEENRDGMNAIRGQRVDASGGLLWGTTGVAVNAGTWGHNSPSAVSDDAGGAIITWNDERGDTLEETNTDIYAQRVNGSGVIQWNNSGVPLCLVPGEQTYPVAVSDGSHGAIISWWDQRNQNTGTVHEYAQHITISGVTTWAVDGLPYNTMEVDDQADQAFIGDGVGGAISAWGDGRNGNGDIYAQKLNGSVQFTGYRTFSPDAIASARDEKGRIGKPVRSRNGIANEVNVLEEGFRLGIFGGNPVNDGLGGLTVGLSYLKTVKGKLQVDRDQAKLHGWLRLGKWNPKARIGMKYQDVLKTLSKNGVLHDGPARGFDFIKEKTSMPPTKHNNVLLAEQIALKLNIIASMCGITKPGFGELRYTEEGNVCSNMLVRDIALEVDSALALPLLSWEYATLYDVVYKINRAFEGSMNVVPTGFPSRLAVKGVHEVSEVPFLQEDLNIQPKMVSQNYSYEETPEEFRLQQNYPNPFNPLTNIGFILPNPAVVTLKVYNMLGQEIATLLDRIEMDEGVQELQFDGSNVSSGVYFYRLTAEQSANEDDGSEGRMFVTTKKMILLK